MFRLERNYNPDVDTEDRAWFTVAAGDTAEQLAWRLRGLVNPPHPDLGVEWHAGRYRVTRTEEILWFDHDDPGKPPNVEAITDALSAENAV